MNGVCGWMGNVCIVQATEVRYAFAAEYFDPQAELMRKYTILFYPTDETLEMLDMKTGKKFLRRMKCLDVDLRSLFVGAVVNIYSRQMKITGFADDATRMVLGSRLERTLGIIKPNAYEHMGKIIDAILRDGFEIVNMRMVRLQRKDAETFYAVHFGKPFFDKLVDFMTSDTIVVMELLREDAIMAWRRLIGPTNIETARAEAPECLRARFGEDTTRNACHGSDSVENAEQEIGFFFGPGAHGLIPTESVVDGTVTCGVIRPGAVRGKFVGKIIDMILEEGFEITGLEQFVLNSDDAAEFLEVYKGIVPEQPQWVENLCNGPCVAVEVRAENPVSGFRELCGPMDPDLARKLRPNTIRAVFGKNIVENAIHCTDLAEDAALESEFFFSLMQKKMVMSAPR
jgi:nucleoside-diphosphate kinase